MTIKDTIDVDAVKAATPKNVKKTNSGDTVSVDTVKGIITIKHADGSEEHKELPVKEVYVTKAMVNVGMSVAHTVNLGHYSSAKISVSLFVPCEAVELEDTYDFIYEWVNRKMTKVTDEIKG